MGIKIGYRTFKDKAFLNGLLKLGHFAFRDAKLAHNITKIVKKWDSESKIAQELSLALIKQFANLDEKGELIPVDGRPGSFEVPDEKLEEFKKMSEKLEIVEFEINCAKVRIDQLEGVELTPLELLALEPILIDMESVKEAVSA